jgi:hypothetical protein
VLLDARCTELADSRSLQLPHLRATTPGPLGEPQFGSWWREEDVEHAGAIAARFKSCAGRRALKLLGRYESCRLTSSAEHIGSGWIFEGTKALCLQRFIEAAAWRAACVRKGNLAEPLDQDHS